MKSNSIRRLSQSDGKRFGLLEQLRNKCFSLHTSSLIVLSACVLGYSVYPAQAEGTRELTSFGGDRPYTFWRNDRDTTSGILRRTVIKVYANPGEEINLGSSAVGIGQGIIRYRRPDGSTGDCGNTGLIQNRDQETAGPAPAAGGYNPCRVVVGAGQGGIWEIDFVSPNPNSGQDPPRDRLAANAAWTQPDSVGYILAWDATVFRSPNNRTPIIGRVYTDYLSLNMGNSGRALNARTYVLTEDGYQYLIDLNGVDPFGFFFFSNNKGFRNNIGDPLYRSVLLPSTGLTPPNYPNAPTPSFLRPDEPNEGINNYTNKLFINKPNDDLPTSARVATNGPTTWLVTPPLPPPSPQLTFRGIEGTPNQTGTAVNNSNPPRLSGNFTFNNPARERPYQIIIDVNRDGIFGNANDRILEGRARVGQNTVNWDARDGAGNPVPASRQAYGVQIYIFAGEVHFPYLDAENNVNGIKIQRLNAPAGFPLNDPDPFLIFYDDEVPGIQTGGGPTNPPSAVKGISSINGGHRYGQAGNESGFGNNVGIDTWAYYPSEPEDLQIIVAAADLQVTKSVTPTTVSVGGTVTYTVTFRNAGPNDVKGARVSDAAIVGADNIQIGEWTCAATGAGAACGAASGVGNFNTTLDLPNGTSATFTVRATIAAGGVSGPTVVNRAQILRTNDTTDPNPENPDVKEQGSGNNVAEATLNIDVPDLSITKTAVGPFVVGQQGTYQINVTNNGSATTGSIQIVDTLPNGVVFFGSSGNGWSCSTTGQQQITCTNPNSLAAGATTTLTVTVTATQAGSGTNVAEVSTPGERNTTNNRAQASTTISNPPNQPPVANDDSSTTNPGVPVNIPVLGNDTDPNNNINPGSVTIITPPGQGTVTPNPNGTITYTPGPGFTAGTDTFVYQVCDAGGLCDRATVTVTVPATAQLPPVAQDRSTPPSLNISPVQVPPLLGTDPDGTVVSYRIASLPPAAQGTLVLNGQPVQSGQTLTPDQVGQLVFQPNSNFTGTVTFNYTVTDNQGLTSGPATVTIPLIAPGNQPPVAENRSTQPLPNTNPISVPQLIGRDPDGTVVSYRITTLPPGIQGTVVLNGQPVPVGQTLTPDQVGQLVFQPNPNFTGTVTFNYTVTDNQGLTSAPATVTMPVIAPGN